MAAEPIKITRVRFCEEFSFGQFRRVNLTGYNFTTNIAFKTFPYQWKSFMVVEGELPAAQKEFNFGFKVTFRDSKGAVYSESAGENPVKPPTDQPDYLMIVVPGVWDIRESGTADVSITINAEPAFAQTFKLTQGDSAYLAKPVPMENSRIVTEGDPTFASMLCSCANKELSIIDCYVSPTVLATVLGGVRADVAVRVMTDPKYVDTFRTELPAMHLVHRQIEVRFARDFHDRFLILDSTDHWHVGASLNGLDKKRVWHYQKLMKRDDVEKVAKRLAEAWAQAKTL